jgi:hypothetical protein
VLAPDSGIISARSATVGAVVGSGHRAVRLMRQGRLEWRAESPRPNWALTVPQEAVVVRDGFSYVFRGERRAARAARSRCSWAAAWPTGWRSLPGWHGAATVVCRGRRLPERRRPGAVANDTAAPSQNRLQRPAPQAPAALRLVDQEPDSGVMLFVLLTLAACCLQRHEGAELPRHRPAHRHRHGASAARRGAGAAGNRGGAQDRERIATLQGLKHIYTKVQDGGPRSPPSSAWKSPRRRRGRRALAVARVRADLPGDLRDPVVTKMDLAGAPILTYTVASRAWTTRR